MDISDAENTSSKIRILKRIVTTRPTIEYLLAALVALVIIDGVITEFLVGNGLGKEGNPLLRNLVGEWSFIVVKVVGAVLCAFLLWDIYRRWSKLALISTWCLVGCYGAIVVWNVIVYFIATG